MLPTLLKQNPSVLDVQRAFSGAEKLVNEVQNHDQMPPSLFCPNPLGPNFKEQTVHWLIWGNVLCFQYGVFPLRDVVRLLNKNGEPILKLCTFLTIFVLGFFGPL